MKPLAAALLLACAVVSAADPPVDPTFLHRHMPDVAFASSDLTSPTCRYRPVFGEGADWASLGKSVARFGEVVVDPGGSCQEVAYEAEERLVYVLEGRGETVYRGRSYPLVKGDFVYIAPTAEHSLGNSSAAPLRVVLMGFRTPKNAPHGVPLKLPVANEEEAERQIVGNHPPSTLYQLLLGDTRSRRDLIAAGQVVTSLFIMEFAPGGTNHPHHHANAEEVYLLLDGDGEMVAGGGMDGVEGRYPARAGDAYFYRLNATVGFYNNPDPSKPKARILAVRSYYPGMEPR